MNISPDVKVWSKPLPTRRHVREDLIRRFGSVPEEYLDVAETWEDLEFEYRGQFFRIWGGLRALEFDDAYRFRALLPGSVPVGDDGGGRFLAYFEGERGAGIYRGGFGVMDPKDVCWVATTMREMVERPETVEWDWENTERPEQG